MDDDITFEIDDSALKMLDELSKSSPKLVKKKFKKIGQNATKEARKLAKQLVKVGKDKKKATNKHYHNGFKTSKVFENSDDEFMVSAYNKLPHSHLIELGHVQTDKNGKVLGHVKGKFVIEKSSHKYERTQFEKDLDDMLDAILDEGGF